MLAPTIRRVSRESTGQYVAYTFYRVDPAWRRLPVEERTAGKDAFAEVVETWSERLEVRTIRDLINKTEVELMAAKNFGMTSLNEIKRKLAEIGLGLRS